MKMRMTVPALNGKQYTAFQKVRQEMSAWIQRALGETWTWVRITITMCLHFFFTSCSIFSYLYSFVTSFNGYITISDTQYTLKSFRHFWSFNWKLIFIHVKSNGISKITIHYIQAYRIQEFYFVWNQRVDTKIHHK